MHKREKKKYFLTVFVLLSFLLVLFYIKNMFKANNEK